MFVESLVRVKGAMVKKRKDLAAMVARGHPMSLRTAYYDTWMRRWSPIDRETALSEAFMAVVNGIKESLRGEAREPCPRRGIHLVAES